MIKIQEAIVFADGGGSRCVVTREGAHNWTAQIVANVEDIPSCKPLRFFTANGAADAVAMAYNAPPEWAADLAKRLESMPYVAEGEVARVG